MKTIRINDKGYDGFDLFVDEKWIHGSLPAYGYVTEEMNNDATRKANDAIIDLLTNIQAEMGFGLEVRWVGDTSKNTGEVA